MLLFIEWTSNLYCIVRLLYICSMDFSFSKVCARYEAEFNCVLWSACLLRIDKSAVSVSMMLRWQRDSAYWSILYLQCTLCVLSIVLCILYIWCFIQWNEIRIDNVKWWLKPIFQFISCELKLCYYLLLFMIVIYSIDRPRVRYIMRAFINKTVAAENRLASYYNLFIAD